jgi:hypothetical protein
MPRNKKINFILTAFRRVLRVRYGYTHKTRHGEGSGGLADGSSVVAQNVVLSRMISVLMVYDCSPLHLGPNPHNKLRVKTRTGALK